MIKIILIIILALLLLHFICGVICIFFYLDRDLRMYFDIWDLILMLIFGPMIVFIFSFLYVVSSIDNLFKKIKNQKYERTAKI